ncbi:hypothetical protein [Frigoriflavimonas asaccharolytica]|uniref:Uncharacterized protein n=1 Tax=Frigoriflavimonas asaccharolytica TaxID=2735899 RepID=A0A8J8K8R3_9FLAO|nr:hypothetical protein [Frigoriflavimonas asaccharolytica]NRS93183.1 hypothetical protein [Frigoriflavimonas asaccharolytica]
MKLNLFFEGVRLRKSGSKLFTKTFFFLLFALFLIPQLLSANAIGYKPVDQVEGVIYISGDAVIFDASATSTVIELPKSEEKDLVKEVSEFKVLEQELTVKIEEKPAIHISHKKIKSKFIFTPTEPSQSIATSMKFNNTISVFTPSFSNKTTVTNHYTLFSVPVYVYLLNIYNAEFSKTAELSQFLFSRPPPLV